MDKKQACIIYQLLLPAITESTETLTQFAINNVEKLSEEEKAIEMGFEGACTLWQLIQIPVLLGVKIIMEFNDFKKSWAWVTGLFAALVTALIVGGAIGGRYGSCGAFIMWWIAGFITFVVGRFLLYLLSNHLGIQRSLISLFECYHVV